MFDGCMIEQRGESDSTKEIPGDRGQDKSKDAIADGPRPVKTVNRFGQSGSKGLPPVAVWQAMHSTVRAKYSPRARPKLFLKVGACRPPTRAVTRNIASPTLV
jgi:hypothetical protein